MDATHLLDLKFVILRARHPDDEHREKYQKVYNLWLKLWSPAYRQIGHGENLRSDIFSRHQEVAAFFYQDEPIAMMLIDSYDLTNQVDLQHSYFLQFPHEALQAFDQMNLKQVMVIGNLAVTHKWRGRSAAIAELMIGMCVVRYLHSGFDGIISYSRNTKGTQHMAYRCGGEAVLANAQAWDEPTDFIVFDRESEMVLRSHPRWELMEKLWRERLHEPLVRPLFLECREPQKATLRTLESSASSESSFDKLNQDVPLQTTDGELTDEHRREPKIEVGSKFSRIQRD